MSYSMSVKLKNKEEVQKVLTFFNDNQDFINQFTSTDKNTFNKNGFILESGESVAYTPSKNKNHFISYGASSIPFYVWAVMAFLAYKNEVKNNKNEYFFYYDDERLKIDTFKEEPTDLHSTHFCILETTGEPILRKKPILSYLLNPNDEKKVAKLIRELNILWDNYDWKNTNTSNNKKSLAI